MKLKKSILLLIGLFIISLSSCGKDYYNSSYKVNKSKYIMSFVPIYNDGNSLMNDTLSTKVFSKNTTHISLSNITETRQIIDSDNKMVEILTKISERKYKGKELKASPNLSTILSQSEIDYLKKS